MQKVAGNWRHEQFTLMRSRNEMIETRIYGLRYFIPYCMWCDRECARMRMVHGRRVRVVTNANGDKCCVAIGEAR